MNRSRIGDRLPTAEEITHAEGLKWEAKFALRISALEKECKGLRRALEIDAIGAIELGVSLITELDKGIRGIEPVEAKLAAMNFALRHIKEALAPLHHGGLPAIPARKGR